MKQGSPHGRRSSLRRVWKPFIRRVRSVPEAFFILLGLLIIPLLPRRAILATANFLGDAFNRLDRHGRRVIMANLQVVFGPEKQPGERARLAKAINRHAALVVLDLFWFSRWTNRRVKRYVSTDEALVQVYSDKQPHIMVTGHLGSWELAGQSATLYGGSLTSVYALLGSGFTQKIMRLVRQTTGQKLVPREGAAISLLRALHDGHMVGLLLDQHTRVNEGGVFVDFMGLPATVSQIAAKLGIRREVPINIARCLHTGNGHYHTELVQSIDVHRDDKPAEVTQRIADALGEAIRETPEQWFWMYRRWKHVKPGYDPQRYPYYARPFNPEHD